MKRVSAEATMTMAILGDIDGEIALAAKYHNLEWAITRYYLSSILFRLNLDQSYQNFACQL
jgi:hypothetical protein